MKKITRVLPCWLLALCLTGLALLAFPAAVAADTPVQNVPVPVSRWMVLNPATNKLYIDSYAGNRFLTVLNGATYVTKSLAYPAGDSYIDVAVDAVHNRIYILPKSELADSPILVVDGATDTWAPSLPVSDTNRQENKALVMDASHQTLYYAEETTGGEVMVHWIDALTGEHKDWFDAGSGVVEDLLYNPVNGCVYLVTSQVWDHTTVWVLDFVHQELLGWVDMTYQHAKLVLNERTGDVYVGTIALDGQQHVVLTDKLPATARVVNPYTNKLFCFDFNVGMSALNGGVPDPLAAFPDAPTLAAGMLYEVDGATFAERALRDFSNITPPIVPILQNNCCIAINPAVNKLYLFSPNRTEMYVYDPLRNLLQTLTGETTQWAAANPYNHRLYIAPAEQEVHIFDGAPTLNISPTTLNFVGLQDGDDPPAQAFIVRMSSSDLGNLRYTITSDASWLSANKTGRLLEWYPVSTTLEAQVQVSVDIADLPASATPYVGHLTIVSEGAKSSPRTVTVTFTVGDGAAPLMQVDAANPARFEAMIGDPIPASQSVRVRNLGAGSLTYTVAEMIPWLDVIGTNPGSVSAGALQAVTLTLNSAYAALEPGTYSAPVTITSDSLGSPQVVNVELLIYPRPRLALSTRTLPLNAFVEEGNPPMQSLFVTNGGWSVLDWTATPEACPEPCEGTAWLQTEGALSGRAPGAFQVGADIAALDLGLYHGQIAVAGASPNVEDSPQTVDVTLKVDTRRRMVVWTLGMEDFSFVEGTTPPTKSFRIYNAGFGGAFDWETATNVDWLTITPPSGAADENGTTVEVSVDPAQLSPGEHHAMITVRGDRVKGEVQTIPVAVFVASAGAPSCLAGTHLDIVKTNLAKIAVDIASVDAFHGGACDVTADVTLDLYGFRHTYRTQGSISDTNDLLLPIADTLKLTLAKVGLTLTAVQISDDALTAQGQWDFSNILGQTRSAGLVRIGRDGISFDGATTFPIDQSWSFHGFTFKAEQATLRTAQSFNDFIMEVDGELTLKIYGSSSVKLDVTLEVSRGGLRAKGSVSEIPLPNFNFSLGGFTVQTKEARFLVSGQVKIARAQINTPGNWGGAAADIYDITIDGNGKVSVGGGKFRLPAIKAGGLNLMSLEGSLREVTGGYGTNGLLQPAADGYEISARGEFGVSEMGSSGPCSIMVEIVVYVNSMGAIVLELAPVESLTSTGPLEADAITGLRLREVTVGVHCLPGVPIGNTSFFITGVEGSITLYDSVESVRLKMWIEHSMRIGPTSLVSVDPQLTLFFSPFAIDFTAGLRLVGVKVSETHAYVDKNHFETTITYDFLIVHGYTSFSAGSYNGKAYIAGSGKTSVGLTKGCIWKKCTGILGCVRIPPWDINVGSVHIDFGTFKNGQFGVKGGINVFGWEGNAFVGFDGTIKFGSLKDYQLVGSRMVRQARAAYASMEQGIMSQMPFNADLSFAPNGDTLVHVTIPALGGADVTAQEQPLAPTNVISTINVLQSDVIFALAQPPDGELEFTLVDRNGIVYTPDKSPSNVEYVQVVGSEDIQSMYFVESALTGDWQVRIIGDTDNTDFTLAVVGNTPAPESLAVLQSTGPATATVTWVAQVAITETSTVKLYAHSGPLTRTVTYTDSEGTLVTETEEVFDGVPLVEASLITTTTVADSVLDFGALPSGIYTLWMEVDDGENPRHRRYILSDITSGPPVTITVDHSATFPVNWTATLTPALTGIQNGDLDVAWVADAHPDALTYTLHLATPGTLTPTLETTRVFTVSDVVYGSVETALVDNILPGQTYTFTLAAHNQQDGRVAWSQPVVLNTPKPDFIVLEPTAPITVPAGGTANVPLTLLIPEDIPFPLALSAGYIAAPDGFTLTFTPETLTATGMVTATVRVAAVSGMYTGTYAVPVIAQSGTLVRGVVLVVTVVEAAYPIYLPLVLR